MSDHRSAGDAQTPPEGSAWPHVEKAPRTPAGLAVITITAVVVGTLYALVWASFWPVAALVSTPGRIVGGLVVAAVAFGLDLRPQVRVSPDVLVAGSHRILLDDIQLVRPQRRERRQAEGDPTVDLMARTLLARDGVLVTACSPEGLPYRLWIASADPSRLTEHIEAARETARAGAGQLSSASTEGVTAYSGVRGAIWYLAVPFLVLFAGVVPWVALDDQGVGLRVAVTLIASALVAVPAASPVRIDSSGLRSAGVRVSRDEVVAARTVPKGRGVTHLLQLPRRNRSVTVWGPAVTIVCVTDPPGETVEERLRATRVLAVPRQVDLSAILPAEVVDRRLPPATGPLPGVPGQ